MRAVRNVLVLALVLAIAAPLMAQEKARRKGEKRGGPKAREGFSVVPKELLSDIQLTAEQKAKLEELNKEMGPKLKELREGGQGGRQEGQRGKRRRRGGGQPHRGAESQDGRGQKGHGPAPEANPGQVRGPAHPRAEGGRQGEDEKGPRRGEETRREEGCRARVGPRPRARQAPLRADLPAGDRPSSVLRLSSPKSSAGLLHWCRKTAASGPAGGPETPHAPLSPPGRTSNSGGSCRG
jgi:hypothetical protein